MELITTIKIGMGKARLTLDLGKPNSEQPLFMDWLADIGGTVLRIIAWKDERGRIKPRGHAIEFESWADYEKGRPLRKVGIGFSRP